MSGIFGLLGIDDTERAFVNTIGQQLVFEKTAELIVGFNKYVNRIYSVFVEETTEAFKERYKLPGGGYLQELGNNSPAAATKAYGSWDVAYPLKGYGAQIAGNRVGMAYMTMQEYNHHLDTVMTQNVNSVRLEILRALFDNVNDTFTDDVHGSLTIVPLANSDSVTYPPVLGASTEATENHYAESGYLATAINDTNNPYVTIRDELEEHFGAGTGGENIVVFINNAERTETEDLTDFDTVPDQFIRVGANADVPVGLPDVPGRILGRCSGVWVVEWRWIPATYMLGIHLDMPKPLKRRVDPADTGLGRDLQLVAETDSVYPMQVAHWEHRFGFGVGNRLNGIAYEVAAGGSYTIPTAYD
jgi:hypothetical protein